MNSNIIHIYVNVLVLNSISQVFNIDIMFSYINIDLSGLCVQHYRIHRK